VPASGSNDFLICSGRLTLQSAPSPRLVKRPADPPGLIRLSLRAPFAVHKLANWVGGVINNKFEAQGLREYLKGAKSTERGLGAIIPPPRGLGWLLWASYLQVWSNYPIPVLGLTVWSLLTLPVQSNYPIPAPRLLDWYYSYLVFACKLLVWSNYPMPVLGGMVDICLWFPGREQLFNPSAGVGYDWHLLVVCRSGAIIVSRCWGWMIYICL